MQTPAGLPGSEKACSLHTKCCIKRVPSLTHGRRAPSAAKDMCCVASKETGPSSPVGQQGCSGSEELRRHLPVLFCNCQCQGLSPKAKWPEVCVHCMKSILAVGTAVGLKEKSCFYSFSPLSPGPC